MNEFLTRENIKQAIISIFIGAVVAFLTSFAEGLTDWLKNNSTEMINGGVASFVYLIRRLHA